MSQTLPETLVGHSTLEEEATALRPPYDLAFNPFLDKMPAQMVLDLNSTRKSLHHFRLYETDGHAVRLAVFRYKDSTATSRPAFYHIHGGGQVAGDRYTGLHEAIDYWGDIDVVFVSVEYRLSPEHPAPAALHDSYVGVKWMTDNAAELGIDPLKIMVFGGSGGAPLAAGCCLVARNRQYPKVHAQMLMAPMLDDRHQTVSFKQFERVGPWCGVTNRMAWDLVLGSEERNQEVHELIAPARAKNLSGLPPTFIDAGACEVFRDEAVAYASQLWKCGVSAELHVWPGAFHAFDLLHPDSAISRSSKAAKMDWIKRIVEAAD